MINDPSLAHIPQVWDYDKDYHLTSKHTQILIQDGRGPLNLMSICKRQKNQA